MSPNFDIFQVKVYSVAMKAKGVWSETKILVNIIITYLILTFSNIKITYLSKGVFCRKEPKECVAKER